MPLWISNIAQYAHCKYSFKRLLRGATLLGLSMGLLACQSTPPAQTFDLGPLHGSSASRSAVALVSASNLVLHVPDIQADDALSALPISYRFLFRDPNEAKQYAFARWTLPPAQLLSSRVRHAATQAGYLVIGNDFDQAKRVQLRMELIDFNHYFETEKKSFARVSVRASILKNQQIIAQKTFQHQIDATTPTANGGVLALQQASEVFVQDLMKWTAHHYAQ